ncbi:MAG: response regulator [Nanoarchaeota archaeon]
MSKPQLDFIYLDDEKSMRDLVSRLIPISFPKFNVEVRMGETGLALAELVRTYKPQGIITDNNMPGMDGVYALANLPNDIVGLLDVYGQPYSIPKVLMTTGKLDEAIRDSERCKLKDISFLAKPYAIQNFMSATRKIWPEYS